MTRLRLTVFLCPITLCACSRAGAPSFNFFGAFFPAWLLCGAFGIVIAIFARAAMTAADLATAIPYQLAVCTSLGVIGALLLWLTAFG